MTPDGRFIRNFVLHDFEKPEHLWPFDPNPTLRSIARVAFIAIPNLQRLALADRLGYRTEIFIEADEVDERVREMIRAAAPVTANLWFLPYSCKPEKLSPVSAVIPGYIRPLRTGSAMLLLRSSNTKALKRTSRSFSTKEPELVHL